MPKMIKVTALIDPDDLPFDYRDSSHEFGVSTLGYDAMMQGSAMVFTGGRVSLMDCEFEQVDVDD